MMKDVHVERITVLEPHRGDPLTIPLRFIDSFEVGPLILRQRCLLTGC
jgi:hypothetical protein